MSTKTTIKHFPSVGEESSHLYTEAFEGDDVFLELEGISFIGCTSPKGAGGCLTVRISKEHAVLLGLIPKETQ